MQATWTVFGDRRALFLRGECDDEGLDRLVARLGDRLREHGLELDDVAFHRFWARDRSIRDRTREARERLLGRERRGASSSFMSQAHILSGGALAIEAIALPSDGRSSRRVVEFSPERRYAHYLVQDGWLFLSGMAEDAPGLEEQFQAAFDQVERALVREKAGWANVVEASLFLEQGRRDAAWLEARFREAVGHPSPRVKVELVDGLASVEKKLEIEIIALL